MSRISFFIDGKSGTCIDASNIKKGNPGIGGTQFCMLLLAHLLSEKVEYKINVISTRRFILNKSIDYTHVKDDTDVIKIAEQKESEFLILRNFSSFSLKNQIGSTYLKVITWSHNFLSGEFCRYVAKTPQIICNVFVGKQQYDAYIDDDIICKSIHIDNMLVPLESTQRYNDSKTVVFMGAICEKKGFLELCRIWPGILRDVPDARLVVLGSGKLYGDVKLGKYGIASEAYENKFIPFITDERGNILPSIEFKGVVGREKYKYFRSASVGVVNPSGARETFGMAIVEMGQVGLPVATIGTTGYFDIIKNGETGLLANNLSKLQKNIIKLLKDCQLNEYLGGGNLLISSALSPENILPKWEKLFSDLNTGNLLFKYMKPSVPFDDNFKWVRLINRFLRFSMRLKFFPSCAYMETALMKIKRLCH